MMIDKVFPMVERPYTDATGQQRVFVSKGFLMWDGIDHLYAEMQGDMARAYQNAQFDLSAWHAVQTQCIARTYKDSQGNERYSNEIRIVKIG